MRAKSFIEILEAQIRAEIREEIRTELRDELEEELRTEIEAQREASGSDVPQTRRQARPLVGNQSAFSKREITDTWLAAHTPTTKFTRTNAAQSAYAMRTGGQSQQSARPASPRRQAQLAAPQSPSQDRWIEVHSPESLLALELIIRYSGSQVSGTRVRESELKAMWRKAALKVHPDRHVNKGAEEQHRMSILFREVTEAYAAIARPRQQQPDLAQ